MSAILSVQELVKTYPGTRKSAPVEAVRGISFEVARGEFFGLLGPNGAGKSTTLGCITTLVRPTSGRIVVDGVDVGGDPMTVKRKIAVVLAGCGGGDDSGSELTHTPIPSLAYSTGTTPPLLHRLHEP